MHREDSVNQRLVIDAPEEMRVLLGDVSTPLVSNQEYYQCQQYYRDLIYIGFDGDSRRSEDEVEALVTNYILTPSALPLAARACRKAIEDNPSFKNRKQRELGAEMLSNIQSEIEANEIEKRLSQSPPTTPLTGFQPPQEMMDIEGELDRLKLELEDEKREANSVIRAFFDHNYDESDPDLLDLWIDISSGISIGVPTKYQVPDEQSQEWITSTIKEVHGLYTGTDPRKTDFVVFDSSKPDFYPSDRWAVISLLKSYYLDTTDNQRKIRSNFVRTSPENSSTHVEFVPPGWNDRDNSSLRISYTENGSDVMVVLTVDVKES